MALATTTDRALFRQTILSWLDTYAGLGTRVIWANQSTIRPAKPYGSIVFPTRFQAPGIDEARGSFNVTSQLIERVTYGPRVVTAQVEVYSDPAIDVLTLDAADMLENALLALQTVLVRDLLRAAKIGMLGHTPVQNLDEQLGDRWEMRAQSDVTFSYSGETFDDGGGGSGDWIETAEIPTEENGNATYGT